MLCCPVFWGAANHGGLFTGGTHFSLAFVQAATSRVSGGRCTLCVALVHCELPGFRPPASSPVLGEGAVRPSFSGDGVHVPPVEFSLPRYNLATFQRAFSGAIQNALGAPGRLWVRVLGACSVRWCRHSCRALAHLSSLGLAGLCIAVGHCLGGS